MRKYLDKRTETDPDGSQTKRTTSDGVCYDSVFELHGDQFMLMA